MGTPAEIPLFPLHTVLFPGGPLPLRIFEARYLDMIGRCLRSDSGFGVVLIRDGQEVGEAATTHSVGTLVSITYWDRRPDGLLGVTVRGEQRFRVQSTRVQSDQLLLAEVSLLPEPEPSPVPEPLSFLSDVLDTMLGQLDHPWRTLPRRPDDAWWVAGRLAELLPLPMSLKQELLESGDPVTCLEQIAKAIH